MMLPGMVRVCLALTVVSLLLHSPSQEKPLVVVTSTVLGSIVEDLAGDQVEVQVILNPALCPAHQDLKPSDVELIAMARLLLYHGFEPFVDRLVEAAGNKTVAVRVGGPWNTFEALEDKYRNISNILTEYLGLDVSGRLENCLQAIDHAENEVLSSIEALEPSRINVIVMAWQADFVRSLGFNVVATYPPPERMSAGYISSLVSLGMEKNVHMVIDNLQSGIDVGREIANRIGAVHVVLTNFPKTSPGVENVTMMLRYNAESLKTALLTAEVKIELQKAQRRAETFMYLSIGLMAVVIVESLIIAVRLMK